MSAASKGAARERQVAELLRTRGYVVVRCAGSKGPADLVAMRRGELPLFVQVKATTGSPFGVFPPAERQALREIAHRGGGTALYVHWPAYRKPLWARADTWPD